MIQTYHHGRFELFIAVIVIAIVALCAVGRYSLMAEDARILRLEIISHHFMTGAANMHIQFLLANIAGKDEEKQSLAITGKTVYFSQQGWPASVSAPVTNNYMVTDNDCYQLWQLLLQNPAPIAVGLQKKIKADYHVSAQGSNCRYQFSDGEAYFDYFPIDGRLIFISNRN